MVKSVCVVGLGYIGLPTATLIANRGIKVYGMDPVKEIVDKVNMGKIHIVEPHLEDYVKKAVANGMLEAKTVPSVSDAFIIAVPTPFRDNHVPDMSYVKSAVEEIAPYVREGNIIILESTSPVGSTENVKKWLLEANNELEKKDLYFAHCPERVLPGKIVEELSHNDRIIGGIDEISTKKVVEFYSMFIDGGLLQTDSRTAEMSKLTENSFRDVNIAFANELSMICERLKINVWELIELANHHPRVNILKPGPGVGGHCIAVDPWFIVNSAPQEARLIKQARHINDDKTDFVIEKIVEACKNIDNPNIACLGLAFKPNIDDLRESPAMKIVSKLSEKEERVILAVEPNISKLPKSLNAHDNIKLVDYDFALNNADVVVILVAHKEFVNINDKQIKGIVIDTQGLIRK